MSDVLRTPQARFQNLPDYPYAPHYADLAGVRMHYVDEGDGPTVLLLHGEPTWSYLYRHMIRALRDDFRVVAPDLIGFGKSDKYASREAYSFDLHREKFTQFVEALDLQDVTLVVHDWGGPIGLWAATTVPQRFARLVILNTFLSTGQSPPGLAFRLWRAFARYSPIFPPGWLVQLGSVRRLSRDEMRAYDAPFPDRQSKAGARVFPLLVPAQKSAPATAAMRETFRALRRWEKPALVAFSDRDPILGGLDPTFRRLLPMAQEQPRITIRDAGHFLQEDKGQEIAGHVQALIRRTRI